MDVKLPDGTVIADVPDGMSKQALVDKLASNGYDTRKLGMTSEAQAYRPPGSTTAPNVQEEAIGGLKHAWDTGAMGLKDLMTKVVGTVPEAIREGGSVKKLWGESTLLPEDQQLLDRGKAFVHETGPASTLGQIGGDIAMTAAPATKLYGGVKAATSMFPKALSMLPSMAAGAAPAAVLTPGGVDERGVAGAMGAVGGAAGELGGRVLTKTLGGLVKPTKEAKWLMEHDVQPTIGQGAESRTLRAVEDITEGIPLVGRAVRSGQARAATEYRDLMAARNLVWNQAADKAAPVANDQTFQRELLSFGSELPQEIDRMYRTVLTRNLKGKTELNGTDLNVLQDDLGKLVKDVAPADIRSARMLAEARNSIHWRITDTSPDAAAIHESFKEFKQARKTAGSVPEPDPIAPVENLDPSAVASFVRRAITAAGLAGGHFAGLTLPAATVFGASAAGSTRPVARAALGGYDAQRYMADVLRRTRAIQAATGAALAEQQRPKALNEYR